MCVCADCFAAVLESPSSIGQTFNVVDGDEVRAWRYAGEFIRRRKGTAEAGTSGSSFRIPVPYLLGLGLAHAAKCVSLAVFGPKGRLPTILDPIRYRAMFASARFPNEKLLRVLNWRPPMSYEQCLEQTYRSKVKSGPSS